MITKIVGQQLLLAKSNIFLFSKLINMGKNVVNQLPMVQLPVRAKSQNEDRFSKQRFYDINNYQRKDRPPRCRYYALQYKNRIYHVFNAYYYPMGRMMSQIATAIRGKNSPLYRNSQADIKNGDICVIVNAEDPLFTGKKLLYKNLKYHTGFIGHLKTYSYKHVLNHKPQLLYFYMLRKFMPKNKISEKYLQNVKIYRGPTHDIPHLPQFAPDKNIYEYLPQANLQQMIRLNPNVKLVSESHPGTAKQQYNRDFEYQSSIEQNQRQYTKKAQQAEDVTKLHKSEIKTKQVLNISPTKLQKAKRKQKRMLDRFKDIRAPYKKKEQVDTGFLYIKDQRKARQMPQFKTLVDQDLPEDDEQIVQDPYGRKAKEAAAKKNQKDNKKK